MGPETSDRLCLSGSFMLSARSGTGRWRGGNLKAVDEPWIWGQEAWLSSKREREIVSKGRCGIERDYFEGFFLRFKRFELFWTIEKEKKKTHNNEGELENKERGRDDNILREKCGNGSWEALERFTCSSGKKKSLDKGQRQGHLQWHRYIWRWGHEATLHRIVKLWD